MRRDLLLLVEMIQAAERAHQLTDRRMLDELQAEQLRSGSLLWNFTVLGEAASQLSSEVKERSDIPGSSRPPAQPDRRGLLVQQPGILHTTATE
jgi:hypothetical protein